MIVVIDYGLGNLNSIVNMLKKARGEAMISSNHDDIRQAEKLILPGVGAFDHGIQNLRRLGLIELLHELVLDKGVPTLGICLGMQLMTRSSEEGDLSGLGWFDCGTQRFGFSQANRSHKVPNMGWRTIRPWKTEGILNGYRDYPQFYFVHSFHCVPQKREEVLATAHYGYEFCCALQRKNIWGVQFHPEKSHQFGMKLMSNFVKMEASLKIAA